MKCELNYKDKTVAYIEILNALTSNTVLEYEVIDYKLLPMPLKNMDSLIDNEKLGIFSRWLENRAIPDMRINIDSLLLSVYGYSQCYFGRMYKYQHMAALLSHYLSPFDSYWINPIHDKVVSYVLEDFRFKNVYLWKHITWNDVQEIKFNPNPEIENFFIRSDKNFNLLTRGQFLTESFAIPSKKMSWIEFVNSRKYLYQKSTQEHANKFIKTIKAIDDCDVRYNDGNIIFDISDYHFGDIVWLSDLIPISENDKRLENLKINVANKYNYNIDSALEFLNNEKMLLLSPSQIAFCLEQNTIKTIIIA